MYKIAICDDDITFINLFKVEVKKYTVALKLVVEITEYTSGEELLEACCKNYFSLIFLDIEMPGISGINVASKLHSMRQGTEIIFVSSFEGYVYESIKYKPFRFIRKKYIDQELPEALNAFSLIDKNSHADFLFYTKDGTTILNVNEIQYMEVFQHYIYVHCNDRSIKVRGTLGNYEKEFQKWGFIRIHKSYLVSYKYIYSVNPTEIILINRIKLPLSKRKNKEVKEKFINYTRVLE